MKLAAVDYVVRGDSDAKTFASAKRPGLADVEVFIKRDELQSANSRPRAHYDRFSESLRAPLRAGAPKRCQR